MDPEVGQPIMETSLDLNKGVPKILMDLIGSCREFLGIDPAWHIYVKMNDTPAGSAKNAACTTAYPVYFNAHLDFTPATIIEAKNIRTQYILHELLHVSLSEIDEVIEEMLALLPRKMKKVLKRKYQDEVERFIQRTVRGITDKPWILQDLASTFKEIPDEYPSTPKSN